MTSFSTNDSTYRVPEDLPPSAWTGHLPFAFWIVEAMAPASLVELGTHYGTSFLGFCQAIAACGGGTRAFAVDTWQGDEHAGFYGDEVHDRLANLVQRKYDGFARLMRMRFDEAQPAFADGSVDLLHIDGLHTYEAVRHDFETWLPKLSRRGVVLFHDTQVRERDFGVWKFWAELQARYPSFEFSHSHGLGMLLVGDQAPEALQALCRLRGTGAGAEVDRAFEALGQRVVQLARADFFETKYEDAEKFRVHYKAVFERAEAALADAQVRIAALEAECLKIEVMRAELLTLANRALSSEASREAMSATLASREADLSAARADLRHRDDLLREARARADLRQGELERLVNSHSWRLTAPLRWLRSCLAALRHRRPLPAYSHMLGVPVFRAPPVRRPSPEPAAALPAAAPESTRQFLEGLFADDASRRAPEFLPASIEPAPEPASLRAKAIAFYLPQFHTFDENEAWWGKGFTEWTNVTKAVPQFLGHHQPQLPADLGFYDLRVPEVLKRQVEMARQYGLHGFAFHYYWFAGKRLMEKPLDLYLAQDDIDFPFCLCWANENWTRRWDGRDGEVLISQVHGPENDLAFIQDLEPYLRDRRYIRVDGRPLLIVYRPSILPDPAATLRRWREHCRAVGIGELFIAMVQFDTEDPREHGFDAAMEFPPHKLARGFEPINDTLDIVNPSYQGTVLHYQSIVESAKTWPDQGFPLIRTVFPGWDNEARRPGKGYTFAFATPARYREWLDFAVGYAERHPVAGERIVMVNAWNEWAEGAKLEPDRRYGHAFLQATHDVLAAPHDARRVLVLSHDAHPHGGQYLALNLARELRGLGLPVSVGLLGPGWLAEDFRRTCPVHEAFDEAGVDALVRRCAEDGTRLVIANTAVSGRVAPKFREHGIDVVTLVHELPGVIRQYGLQDAVAQLVQASRHVVAPGEAVARGLAGFADPGQLAEKLVVQPQGLFTRSRYRGQRDNSEARAALRERLGLPPRARVVLAVGYADPRKGVDLLADAAVRLADVPDLHFVVGGPTADTDVQDAVDRVRARGRHGRPLPFHRPGFRHRRLLCRRRHLRIGLARGPLPVGGAREPVGGHPGSGLRRHRRRRRPGGDAGRGGGLAAHRRGLCRRPARAAGRRAAAPRAG